jgi:hypothetical protein
MFYRRQGQGLSWDARQSCRVWCGSACREKDRRASFFSSDQPTRLEDLGYDVSYYEEIEAARAQAGQERILLSAVRHQL